MNNQDFTLKKWFYNKKSSTKKKQSFLIPSARIVNSIKISTFAFRQLFGFKRDELFIGNNRFFEENGYVRTWDNKYACDRCGEIIKYKGARSLKEAYNFSRYPWTKHCGLCEKCNELLEKEQSQNLHLSYNQEIRDIYRDRYIWL